MMGKAAFLLPEFSTVPASRARPVMTNLSIVPSI
jgi:hypothetical protein